VGQLTARLNFSRLVPDAGPEPKMGRRDDGLSDRPEEARGTRRIEREPRGEVAGRERFNFEDGGLDTVGAGGGAYAKPDPLRFGGRGGRDDPRASQADVFHSRGLSFKPVGARPKSQPDAILGCGMSGRRSSVFHGAFPCCCPAITGWGDEIVRRHTRNPRPGSGMLGATCGSKSSDGDGNRRRDQPQPFTARIPGRSAGRGRS
jgi:hypothetical protein